ncbi:MAG: phosphatidylserine decarboxylase family protein [Cytophagales bacterium]|nr:MAG: phosphatidylserine decarboxylase family protein [Cytophagales bacterium]TAF60297.1 MAG: phosphatidylserine decarboxylase family protein [Cytophagales bacterium]
MTIHREGYISLFLAILFMAALYYGLDYAFPRMVLFYKIELADLGLALGLIVFVIVLQFFRNPTVKTPYNDAHIIAPCDGKVVVIEEVEEPEYFKGKRRQVSIFMSPFNVHVNRNPITGLVRYCKYHPGLYLVAWHPKSSTENERTTVVIQHPTHGQEVLFRQIAGALARRIVYYIKEGQPVRQGAEMGFIKFGSRVDLFLPLDATINVKIGDKTTGGETHIATFNV